MNISTFLTRPALVIVAAVAGLAAGRFLFPFVDPTLTLPLNKGEGTVVGEGALAVDSLISSWCDARSGDVYFAARMVPVNPPIPGAKFGFFPERVRRLALQVDSIYHIPAPVVLAQFALESRFGLSDLHAFNFFGHTFPVALKYGPRPAQRAMGVTREFINDSWVTIKRPFAKYSSVTECFLVHGKFLSTSPLYKRALSAGNPDRYAIEIGRHYATDPDYALKLITIMKRYSLKG